MKRGEIFATIHGYICSDGGIYNRTVKDWHGKRLRVRRKLRTRFFNETKELIDDFMSSIKKLYPKVKSIRHYPKRKEVEIRNDTVSKDILKLGKVWSYNWEFPQNLTNKQKLLWIRAFIDCDGTVQNRNYDRFIAIDSVNGKGLEKISETLKKFEMPNKIYKIKSGSFRLKIYGKENLIRFRSLITLKHPEKRTKLISAINSYKK